MTRYASACAGPGSPWQPAPMPRARNRPHLSITRLMPLQTDDRPEFLGEAGAVGVDGEGELARKRTRVTVHTVAVPPDLTGASRDNRAAVGVGVHSKSIWRCPRSELRDGALLLRDRSSTCCGGVRVASDTETSTSALTMLSLQSATHTSPRASESRATSVRLRSRLASPRSWVGPRDVAETASTPRRPPCGEMQQACRKRRSRHTKCGLRRSLAVSNPCVDAPRRLWRFAIGVLRFAIA